MNEFTLSSIKHGGGSVILWAYFSSFGTDPLLLIERKIDRFVYLNIHIKQILPHSQENLLLLWKFRIVVTSWFTEEQIPVLE